MFTLLKLVRGIEDRMNFQVSSIGNDIYLVFVSDV